jgi:LmbE family N-acetylglucosaminyl deacetylase
MIELCTGRLSEIAVVGAHCDDVAIGMGGTLLSLTRATPGLRVRALVLSGAGTEREDEERAALAAFCPDADLTVTIERIPDGRAPEYWMSVKQHINAFRRSCDPDVVFGPHRDDAHQDHRLLAEVLTTEFRDHLILGFEILKWEGDTPQPVVFHALPTEVAREKADLLMAHYGSQKSKDWFDPEAFLGLSRLRGVQCRARHAEAFVVEKVSIHFGAPRSDAE